jgi:hypothetical protein
MRICIDSYDVTDDMQCIANKNPDVETAIYWGWWVSHATTNLKCVLEYTGIDKAQWQVSIPPEAQEKSNKKLAAQWYDSVAQWHQHLEKYNHAHDFSVQDKKSIEAQREPVHLLLYKTEDGSVRVKAVDTHMKPVPFVVKGVTMDIINIFDDTVEEYREAA